MNNRGLNWTAGISYVAGGGLSAAFALGGPKWTGVGMALVAVGGLIQRIVPAQKIIADAPIVDHTGEQIATNVTTNSTLPIKAPQVL